MNLNFNKLISSFLPFLFICTLAILVSKIAYIYLPKNSVTHTETKTKDLDFINYNYLSSFDLTKIKKKAKKTTNTTKETKYLLDENLKLKAIYLLNQNDGFAVIEEKNNAKTKTIAKGEYFKEYKLIKIGLDYIVFEKDSIYYKLYMSKVKHTNNTTSSNIPNITYQDVKPKIIEKGTNNYVLEKNDLLSYSKDLKKIWNNIGLKTYKQNNKPIGFKVYKLQKKSVFYDLGLRVNDIIIKANNIVLNNYQNAFKVYNLVDKMELLQLTIKRGDKEMEISYEIE